MGIPTLIKTLTASDDASLSFVNGTDDVVLDGTYDEYMFVFTDVRADTDDVHFEFQVSTDGGSSYGMTITSVHWQAHHTEDGSSSALQYQTDMDLAEAASGQRIAYGLGNDADQSVAGILHLFSPSNTTYAKHFYSTFSNNFRLDAAYNSFAGGYINSTSDVDAIQFAMHSGNIANGTIQMYGIS